MDAEKYLMATTMDEETGKLMPKVMIVSEGTESDICEQFNMAVALDLESGKPMPKMYMCGGSGGTGSTVDLSPITARLDSVESVNKTQNTNISNLTSSVNTITQSNAQQGQVIQSLEGRMTQAETIHHNLDVRVTNNTAEIDELQNQVLELLARLEALETPTP